VSRRSLHRCVIRDPDDRALKRLARGPSCPNADTGPCGTGSGAEHCLLAKPVSDDSTGQAELAVHPFEMAPESGHCLGDASGALTSSPSGDYAQQAYLGRVAGAMGRATDSHVAGSGSSAVSFVPGDAGRPSLGCSATGSAKRAARLDSN
jgi:hypothetical protein